MPGRSLEVTTIAIRRQRDHSSIPQHLPVIQRCIARRAEFTSYKLSSVCPPVYPSARPSPAGTVSKQSTKQTRIIHDIFILHLESAKTL